MFDPNIEIVQIENCISYAARQGARVLRWQLVNPPTRTDRSVYLSWIYQQIQKLKVVSNYATANRIKFIIDLHHPFGTESEVLGVAYPVASYFTKPEDRAVILEAWKIISSECKDLNSVRAYDLLNEPRAANHGHLNSLHRDLISQIRASGDNKKILIEPILGDPARIGGLEVFRDKKIIYSPHFYLPMNITHQGAGYPVGKIWNGDTKQIEKNLLKVRSFQLGNNVDIVIGEFGCTNLSAGNNQARWIRDCVSVFNRYKWGWINHAIYEWQGWSTINKPAEHYLKNGFNNF